MATEIVLASADVPTGTGGTLDITAAELGTTVPKGALLFGNHADPSTDGVNKGNALWAFGAIDSAGNEICEAHRVRDSSDLAGHNAVTNACYAKLDSSDSQTFATELSYNAWIAGGLRVDRVSGQANGSPVHTIQFAGEGVQSQVFDSLQDQDQGVATTVSFDFEPNFIAIFGAGGDRFETSKNSPVGNHTGYGGSNVSFLSRRRSVWQSVSLSASGSAAPRDIGCVVSTKQVGVSYNPSRQVSVVDQSYDWTWLSSSQLQLTPKLVSQDPAPAPDLGFAAFYLPGMAVHAGLLFTPTETGRNELDLTSRPLGTTTAIVILPNQIPAANSEDYLDDPSGGSHGLGVWTSLNDDEICAGVAIKNSTSGTNAISRRDLKLGTIIDHDQGTTGQTNLDSPIASEGSLTANCDDAAATSYAWPYVLFERDNGLLTAEDVIATLNADSDYQDMQADATTASTQSTAAATAASAASTQASLANTNAAGAKTAAESVDTKLSAGRATNLDNLDEAISSRSTLASQSSHTTQLTSIQGSLVGISSNASSAATNASSASSTATAINSKLPADTATKLGNLDAAVSSVSGGTTQPRVNQKFAKQFVLPLSRRSDGTITARKRVRIGASEQPDIAVDTSPLYGDGISVKTVGTPVVVASGELTATAIGPRDEWACVSLDGGQVAGNNYRVDVALTMETDETITASFYVDVVAPAAP